MNTENEIDKLIKETQSNDPAKTTSDNMLLLKSIEPLW